MPKCGNHVYLDRSQCGPHREPYNNLFLARTVRARKVAKVGKKSGKSRGRKKLRKYKKYEKCEVNHIENFYEAPVLYD